MFKTISIKNFKLFEKFTCDSLGRINVFTGDNNTGKSTLLEAMFLLCGYSSISLIENILGFRNLKLAEARDLSFLFSHLNFKNNIHIEALYGEDKVTLKYQTITKNNADINGIESIYKYNSKENGREK